MPRQSVLISMTRIRNVHWRVINFNPFDAKESALGSTSCTCCQSSWEVQMSMGNVYFEYCACKKTWNWRRVSPAGQWWEFCQTSWDVLSTGKRPTVGVLPWCPKGREQPMVGVLPWCPKGREQPMVGVLPWCPKSKEQPMVGVLPWCPKGRETANGGSCVL